MDPLEIFERLSERGRLPIEAIDGANKRGALAVQA